MPHSELPAATRRHDRRAIRSRSGRLLALLAVLTVVAAACNVPSNDPEGYDDAVRANFIDGCTGNIPETGGTSTTLASGTYCSCAYGVFEAQVPFNDDQRNDSRYSGYPADAPTFVAFNEDLKNADDPAKVWESLPTSVREALNSCGAGGPGPLAPDGS